ncbi:DUF1427 family protein [Acidithiobacillus sp. IBUN Pt1247-S3]|uniref:DUF1427 family protein n=1 Tax=Acidithiobacillus sp. IBUN Pt1247-S3 TaxID=3166642 RepID=UPI0034E44DB1
MFAKTVKPVAGIVVAFLFGFTCRAFGIPSPAPPVIMGAILVMAMTVGTIVMDRVMTKSALRANDGGDPSEVAEDAPAGDAHPRGVGVHGAQTHDARRDRD